MSGLLLRPHMNAGQDGFRNTGPKHQGGLEEPKGFPEYPVSRIDRSHHLLLSCKLLYHQHVVKIRTSRMLASRLHAAHPVKAAPDCALYVCPEIMSFQAMRAILLASATAASLGGLRLSSSANH